MCQYVYPCIFVFFRRKLYVTQNLTCFSSIFIRDEGGPLRSHWVLKFRARSSYWGLLNRDNLRPHVPPTDEEERFYYLYLTGISPTLDEAEKCIYEEFRKYGRIGHINLRQSQAEAFVGFQSASGARAALRDEKYRLNLSTWKLTLAHTNFYSLFP